MKRRPITSIALAAALAIGCLCGRTVSAQDQKRITVLPVFEVDSHFPTMPDHMLLGGVGGATADVVVAGARQGPRSYGRHTLGRLPLLSPDRWSMAGDGEVVPRRASL
jgi:hypothetical protein